MFSVWKTLHHGAVDSPATHFKGASGAEDAEGANTRDGGRTASEESPAAATGSHYDKSCFGCRS
jgi:hypothetical protein